jgi:hypothetical protein
MNLGTLNDLKDLLVLAGFIGGYMVMQWRVKQAEAMLKDQREDIDALSNVRAAADQIHDDHARRIERLEDRVYNGRLR